MTPRARLALACAALLALCLACIGAPAEPKPPPGTPGATEPAPTTIEAPPPRSLWRYHATQDEMSGEVRTASVTSTNAFEIGFPYQGQQRGTLTLRSHPRHGLDVYVRVERGQILCREFQGERVSVRFDEEAAQSWRCNGSGSGDSTVIFLRNPERFLSSVRRSSQTRIEITLYRAGSLVLSFDTSGLEWESLAPTKRPRRQPSEP